MRPQSATVRRDEGVKVVNRCAAVVFRARFAHVLHTFRARFAHISRTFRAFRARHHAHFARVSRMFRGHNAL